MACDTCGKVGTSLEQLRDCYQTDDIKAICPECMKIVNKQLSKIRTMSFKMNESLLKRFMRSLRPKEKNRD